MLPKQPIVLSKSSILWGIAAASALLVFYGAVLWLVGGWPYAREKFAAYWPYTVALMAGFGIQAALYADLRRLVRGPCPQAKVLAASGATSAVAAVSCCTHYLASLLPIVYAGAVRGIVAQFQIQLFWLGLLMSAAGIAWIGAKVAAATKEHARCAVPG